MVEIVLNTEVHLTVVTSKVLERRSVPSLRDYDMEENLIYFINVRKRLQVIMSGTEFVPRKNPKYLFIFLLA